MRKSAIPLTCSSILAFKAQNLILRRRSEKVTTEPAKSSAQEEVLANDNRLIQAPSVTFFEPEDLRKCLEKIIPQRIPCVVLLNETPA